jgi:hypothetical protein
MELGSFETGIISVFAIALIIALIVVAILLKKQSTPSVTSDVCPDFWYNSYYELNTKTDQRKGVSCTGSQYGCCPDKITPKDQSGSNCPTLKCYNYHKLGNSSCDTEMDFTTPEYTGDAGQCKKRDWAKACGLTWDGITDASLSC